MNNYAGKLILNQSLAQYTSWRVGGKAKCCYMPKGLKDLALFMSGLPEDEPLLWMGLGSNTLIRDGGYQGTVILTLGGLNEITALEDNIIRVEAGVACAKMARHCARQNLQGIEFLAGIPGTVGGALAMNAGCDGGETWEWVTAVETIDRQGQIHLRSPEEFSIAYRHVGHAREEWFVAGHFALEQGEKSISLQRIKKLLDRRAATQPTDLPSCGSVFRNPKDDYAARLIEACGLKGHHIGDAGVSTKHANFIINSGNATAKDIEALITHVQKEVREQQDVLLIHEVHIIGDPIREACEDV